MFLCRACSAFVVSRTTPRLPLFWLVQFLNDDGFGNKIGARLRADDDDLSKFHSIRGGKRRRLIQRQAMAKTDRATLTAARAQAAAEWRAVNAARSAASSAAPLPPPPGTRAQPSPPSGSGAPDDPLKLPEVSETVPVFYPDMGLLGHDCAKDHCEHPRLSLKEMTDPDAAAAFNGDINNAANGIAGCGVRLALFAALSRSHS